MSDFKAKMLRIQFRLATPQTPLGELSAPRAPSLDLRGPTCKGRGEKCDGVGTVRKGRGNEGRVRDT